MATVSARESPVAGIPSPRGSKVVGWLLAGVLVTAGSWFVVHDGQSADDHPGDSPSERRDAALSVTPAGMKTLTDAESGYRLTYPSAWAEVHDTANPADARGHVVRIGDRDAFSVHTFPLERRVTVTNLADMRAVTDAILSTPRADLTVLDVRQVEVAGLPAIYYLYYFPAGRRRGIHAHYFIFDGSRMQTLVFQVVPSSRFPDYADQFDQVVASFEPIAH